jgi:hypothetical protein
MRRRRRRSLIVALHESSIDCELWFRRGIKQDSPVQRRTFYDNRSRPRGLYASNLDFLVCHGATFLFEPVCGATIIRLNWSGWLCAPGHSAGIHLSLEHPRFDRDLYSSLRISLNPSPDRRGNRHSDVHSEYSVTTFKRKRTMVRLRGARSGNTQYYCCWRSSSRAPNRDRTIWVNRQPSP